jgi:cyclase
MKKKRVLAVLLIKDGVLVQSKKFERHQNLGNPFVAVKRLSEWACDELIYLDITDKNISLDNESSKKSFLDIINQVSKSALMPISVGGGIKTIDDIEERLAFGADKICINTIIFEDKAFIGKCARKFGSQCIVASIDIKKNGDDFFIFSEKGTRLIEGNPCSILKNIQNDGAGEIFLNFIDRDGMKNGYDIDLINKLTKNIKIPFIVCGGAGHWSDFKEIFDKTKADAAAAANIFHHIDQSMYLAKNYLYENNCNVRKPQLLEISNEN